MKRFILPAPPDGEGCICLSGGDYHYLVRVRRLGTGQSFQAFLPGGGECRVHIFSVEDGVLRGRCLDSAAGTDDTDNAVILFQALPRGPKMDLIVRQAAEGGIAEIVPFFSAFSVPHSKEEKGCTRLERWERIVKEARQQSGSMAATRVRAPLDGEGLFAYWEELRARRPGAAGILFHQIPLAKGSLHGYLEEGPDPVVLAVGPEGGFSPAEADRFVEAGFKPFVIGDTVLRVETAALYAAAAVRVILLERDSWKMKVPGR